MTAATPATLLGDPSTRAVLDGIRHIVRTLREASRESERSAGVSAAQLFVLQRLAGGGPLSVNELAARTLTHQSSVSVVVTKLAAQGLVARQRATADARRLEVSLTAAGRAVLGRAPAAPLGDRVLAALAVVGHPTRQRLARDLRALLDAMGVAEPHAPMFFEAPPRRKGARRVRGRH
jgi:DNA-binding MarR family transcriptional regulator